jgi:hypothetical protein
VRCARCGHDATYPQRSGRRCPSCRLPFAFEPREGDPLSDMAWKAALEAVSSEGTVRFVLANLHHEVARRKKPSDSRAVAGVAGVVLTIIATAVLGSVAAAAGLGALVTGGVGTAGLIAALRPRPGLTLSRGEFEALFARWVAAHGVPAGLVTPPRAPPSPYRAELAQELEAYSFDRAVICDRRDTVDLLLANDFHFENNCAVLSADGHPEHAFALARRMLRGNPRLEVFVLHDATPAGCVLAHQLAHDAAWFGGGTARIVDVALRPAQGERMMQVAWSSEAGDVPPHPALSDDERRWLARWRVEVAAVRPEQLVKRLFRAMHAPAGTTAATGTTGGGDGTFTTHADAADGGGDSFG